MKPMNRTKFSNPLNANPGSTVGGPSPSSESVKGSPNRGSSPESTTRNTDSETNVGPDHLKGAKTEEADMDKDHLKREADHGQGQPQGVRKVG